MKQFDQAIANKGCDWAELRQSPDCSALLPRGMPHQFSCRPFGDRIRINLPPLMDEQLLDRIVQLTHLKSSFRTF
jgi:hypothetical protein